MSIIPISASTRYSVEIAGGLLSGLGQRAAQVVSGRVAFVVTDDNVAGFCLYRAVSSLEDAGFRVFTHIIPHGEPSKSGENYLELLNLLAESRLTRSDLLVTLGGGVVGDLAGFAAATYLRGIPYIQIPTTLLAMVDSSVGGKTAIDLPMGKNLAGAFYPPKYVLCDPELLATLPENVFRDGCAEVIKYAILGSPKLFHDLMHRPVDEQLQAVIETCITMKRSYVQEDEFDRGTRQFLNLGHTLGHGVESASSFSLSHGQAVAIGMAMVSRAAVSFGFCAMETCREIEDLLTRFGLPIRTEIPHGDLLQAALGDKKRQGGKLTLVVPKEIGCCILHRIGVEELPQWIALGG